MKIDKAVLVFLWHHYHGLDWCLVVVLYIVTACVTTLVQPHCRTFHWTDASIGYPMKPDTFPNWSVVLFVIIPFLLFIFGTLVAVPWLQKRLPEPLTFLSPSRFTKRRTSAVVLGDDASGGRNQLDAPDAIYGYDVRQMPVAYGPLYAWIRAYVWAIAMQLFVMAAAKSYAGRLRPDYIDRLRKANYTAEDSHLPDPTTHPDFYCKLMDDHPDLKEGRFSFPSGHSSTSFVASTMMCLYLLAHLRPFARQGSFVRLCIVLCPFWPAFVCAISRTRDNKHHFSDILSGTLLGMVCAVLSFMVCFREVGGLAGALNLYVARTENDAEYVQWQRNQPVNQYEMRAQESAGPDVFSVRSAKATTAVEVAEGTLRVAENTVEASTSPLYPQLSEKQMNQNAYTVPWL